jgi:hypothetical protein
VRRVSPLVALHHSTALVLPSPPENRPQTLTAATFPMPQHLTSKRKPRRTQTTTNPTSTRFSPTAHEASHRCSIYWLPGILHDFVLPNTKITGHGRKQFSVGTTVFGKLRLPVRQLTGSLSYDLMTLIHNDQMKHVPKNMSHVIVAIQQMTLVYGAYFHSLTHSLT